MKSSIEMNWNSIYAYYSLLKTSHNRRLCIYYGIEIHQNVIQFSFRFIYKKHRTIKGALFGTLIATGVSTILACIANWLILIPAYVSIAHFSIEQLVGMMSYIPNVTVENFMVIYIFAGVLPFNLFRYLIVLALTFLLYKRTHIIFDKISYR